MFVKLIVLFLALHHTVARNINETPSQTDGLYDSSDDVLVLNNETFNESIFNQNHATIVEFYNSFCGFCRKYAPSWKAFASDVNAWQNVAQIAAVNCAADENNNLCRKYEVMAYPSLRYFPPNFNDANNWGQPVVSDHESDKLRNSLVRLLRNETNPPANWPKLKPAEDTSRLHLFNDSPEEVKFIFLVFGPGLQTMPNEVALDFNSNPHLAVKWINETDIANSFGISSENILKVIGRNSEEIHISVQTQTRDGLLTAIKDFLTERNLNVTVLTVQTRKDATNKNHSNVANIRNDVIYLKDLQLAAWYSLNHEVAQFSVISGERLEALQKYVNIIKRLVLII